MDVAERAGVSLTTVSRYLKGELPLRAETEARVISALDEVGYRRPPARRVGSPSGTRRTIGMIVPEVGSAFFGELVDEVVRAAQSFDLAVYVCNTLENHQRHSEYLGAISRITDGIISTGYLNSEEALRDIVDSGFPVVLLHNSIASDTPLDCVSIDDYSGAYQATSLLLANGHRQIAMVGGLPSSDLGKEIGQGWHATFEHDWRPDLERGWRDALERAGVDSAQQLRIPGPLTEDFGSTSLSHLFAAHEVPTGVVAASDRVALGMFDAASKQGRKIPEDLSVVGFDGISTAALVTPRLTTVRVPTEKMARNAVRLLVDRIAHTERSSRLVTVPVALVEGQSVGTPRTALARTHA